MSYVLEKGTGDHKLRINFPGGGSVQFGARGYGDYIKFCRISLAEGNKHKERYIARHYRKEKWGRSGIQTAGFWSRWLLWNKPTLQASIRDVEDYFGIKITTSQLKSWE